MLKKRLSKNKRSRPRSAGAPALPPAVRTFVDAVGAFIENWGFKRVQGEIWALVYLAERPLTASEIAQLLGVSKALVSLAMSELLQYRVLLLAEGGDARSQRLVPNEQLGEAIATVLRVRERRLLTDAKASIDALQSMPSTGLPFPVDARRVGALDKFVGEAERGLELLATMVQIPQ